LPQILAFKIIQESLDSTRVLTVSEEELSPELVEKIKVGFKARLGQGVRIAVEEVTEIPAEKSGKFRYVVSMVAPG
jgi:phenylacetate-CoA ligase